MCATTITAYVLPYNFVELKYVRNWLKYLNPDFASITRSTAKENVTSMHKREKEILKQDLENLPTRVSLIFDLWTPHYVESNWNLKSMILNLSHMPPLDCGSKFFTYQNYDNLNVL